MSGRRSCLLTPVAASRRRTPSGGHDLPARIILETRDCVRPMSVPAMACVSTRDTASLNASAGVSGCAIPQKYSRKHIPASPNDSPEGIFLRVSSVPVNVTAIRVVEGMKAIGIDQPKLADDLRVSQGTISKIVSGKTRNSRLLPRIALRLGLPLEYLLGESDDPRAGQPWPPAPTLVSLQVALPSQIALARMFEGLLRELPPELDMPEQAQLLAKWLPIALSQAKDLLPIASTLPPSGPEAERELAEALSTQDRARRS